MKVLDRYLIRELIIPIFFCSFSLVFLILIADLFDNLDELLKNHVPIGIISRYYLSLIPFAFIQTIAWSSWLGTIFLLVNFGLHNELSAMKAAGLKITTIARPILFLGLLIGIVTFLVSDRVVPKTFRTANDLLEVHIEKKKDTKEERTLKNVTFYSGDNQLYYFRTFYSAKEEATDIIILWLNEIRHNTFQKVIAKKAFWTNDKWTFENITEYQTDGQGRILGDPRNILKKTYPDLKITPRDLINAASDIVFLSYHELKYFTKKLKENGASVTTENVDLHLRLATPWQGLIMMLISIPFLGTIKTRGSIAINVLACAGMIFAYQLTGIVAIGLGKAGYILPFISAWGNNILFAAIAFVRLEKANF